MKRIFSGIVLVLLCCRPFYAQTFKQLKTVPTNIEIEVMRINVIIIGTDESTASYCAILPQGKRLSCVENRGTFSVHSIYETEGTITIKLPKSSLVESLWITACMGNIDMSNLRVVHATVLLTRGDIKIADCTFKTSDVTHNTGNMIFNANVKSSAVCVSNVVGDITYTGNEAYSLDYSQAQSHLIINKKPLTQLMGTIEKKAAKKNAILSVSASVVNVTLPEHK